ncbi:uncharacterized protein LY79DRAFT_111271 [Colletotrichum navitas]|uniref:Uncharacterized protein n=1 Tax=Colletotrichum navitas TaxID=681940 RepID=A0AAD8Q4D8_9PEZI|nr:uncharacterized protein LY79DRAFT_111271 [Colletotrichum navitas]KAK1595344.1 hypothetical protein LY79DRAFT_111271 [Colletotrichum navitas]
MGVPPLLTCALTDLTWGFYFLFLFVFNVAIPSSVIASNRGKMVQPKSASIQQWAGPESTRNANKDRSIPTATGIPSVQRQAAASDATLQEPVSGVSYGSSVEPRSGKRAFTSLVEDYNSYGLNGKRARVTMQKLDQYKCDRNND